MNQKDSSFEALWLKWKQDCSGDFLQNWDESRIRSKVESMIRDPGRYELVGAGAEFDSYRFSIQSFEYVASISRSMAKLDPHLRNLNKRLTVMHHIVLIPPFKMLEVADRAVLVTPFGEPNLNKTFSEELLKICSSQLAAAGFTYNDVYQIRSKNGVPFLIDLASIRKL